ncbi:hypothetical protein PR048_013578 [Dryococelus australis]|uniref:Uncharacterized protein n=1 Tax=Dryococelus australis TaxID=614101 RepID=A0ABQ9HU31_9NEOP|nr:hypothetical protein PR048_013578 [Dryococelus australis]
MLEEGGLKVTDIRQMKKTVTTPEGEKTQVQMSLYIYKSNNTDNPKSHSNVSNVKASGITANTCVIFAGNHHIKLCPQKLQSTIAYKCVDCEG